MAGNAEPVAANFSLPPDVLKLTRQLEQDKLDSLSRRHEILRKENEQLKARLEKGEKDTHEFVAYFQTELEAKDDRIARLNEELAQQQAEAHNAKEASKASYEEKLRALEEKSGGTELALRARLKLHEDELAKLETFRDKKSSMEDELAERRDEIKRLEQNHLAQLTANERKFLSEKAKMQKDMEKRTNEIRRQAKMEMQQGLDADTRKIIADNRRMGEELRFQQQMTSELQEEKRKVEEEAKLLGRDVSLGKEKEAEYAKQAHHKSREIKRLVEKVSALEELVKDAGRKFQGEKSRLRKTMAKDLEEQTLDAAGLRQLLKLKNRELRQVRHLAQTIVEQRTEVEQYFLEALDDIKEQIRARRTQQYQTELVEYRRQMQAAAASKAVPFPRIRKLDKAGAMHADEPESALPLAPDTKVDLKELTLEDRERVLRLLFAKINAVQGAVPQMPPHELEGGPTPFMTQLPPPHPPSAPSPSSGAL